MPWGLVEVPEGNQSCWAACLPSCLLLATGQFIKVGPVTQRRKHRSACCKESACMPCGTTVWHQVSHQLGNKCYPLVVLFLQRMWDVRMVKNSLFQHWQPRCSLTQHISRNLAVPFMQNLSVCKDPLSKGKIPSVLIYQIQRKYEYFQIFMLSYSSKKNLILQEYLFFLSPGLSTVSEGMKGNIF